MHALVFLNLFIEFYYKTCSSDEQDLIVYYLKLWPSLEFIMKDAKKYIFPQLVV